jgi:hypothetical protein
VMTACKDSLNKHGIAIIQTPAPSRDGRLALTTKLLHESGEWMAGTGEIPVDRPGPQAYGSALTYARRYFLGAMVGVCPEDDDGNGANGRDEQPQRQHQKQRPAQQAATKDAGKEPTAAAPGPDEMSWHQFCIDAKAIADGRGISDKCKPALQKFGKSQGIRPIAISSVVLEEALAAMCEDRFDWDDATIRQPVGA